MSNRKFKMPTSYTTLFILISLVAVVTWFVPGGEWVDGVYSEIETQPQGIYNILSAPIEGFFSAVDIALFVMVIGGFLAIVMKTGAIDAGVGTIIKKNEGKEYILIPVLMTIFALGGTSFGLAEETVAFYPLLIPVLILSGYDTLVAMMIILVGSGVGVLGSTVNPFAIGTASEAAGISMGDGLGFRALYLVIITIVAILYTLRYANKVKKDKTKSNVYDLYDEHQKAFNTATTDVELITKKQKIVLFLFGLTFFIMIVGVIPWGKIEYGDGNTVTIFNDIHNWLAKFSILGLENNSTDMYWDNYSGAEAYGAALGDWWFGQMIVLFFAMSIIIGKVYGYKEDVIVSTFIDGARDLLGVSLVVGMSAGIKIILQSSGMDATLLYYASESLKGFGEVVFINLAFLFYLPMSFLIPSTSGLAGSTMPVLAPLSEIIFETAKPGTGSALTIMAFSHASGIINIITPTSGVVLGGLALCKVPYTTWIKHLAGFVGLMIILSMSYLTILTLILR